METKKKALVEIVGAEFVIDDPVILDKYASDRSYAQKRKPWFVVRPKTAEQVQALVAWANQTETPLIPVSRASAFPWRHGAERAGGRDCRPEPDEGRSSESTAATRSS